jgi:hypothetical protein
MRRDFNSTAERKTGELLKETKESGERRSQGSDQKSKSTDSTLKANVEARDIKPQPQTLADLGIQQRPIIEVAETRGDTRRVVRSGDSATAVPE